ncbi:hypothetical protein DFA_05047 [Cavenderia fasciculata]|uniref:Leucine-rich repeat-containing protein n=1 Tax=Cavenderia fasciculata TaxID=261658 RepID=F4PN64_CACFS|nr:uncharacterized protein DFA_05047 [Cavenderia fasciculata]EGG22917.1 hypothetical protein DFA_05047 [Cavenderia fasciculata]|eukprot:XP_004360768.1 hypothetical protein DFA_05047 [Cavenderia fasciculata]
MSDIQLSQYIQSCIIERWFGSNLHGDKDTFQGRVYWFMMYNGEKRRSVEPIATTRIIDVALVSKWWLKVVRQRSSVYFRGQLDALILESIHSSSHSIYSSNNIHTLKWSLKGLENFRGSTLNYSNQLMQLLPHLQTINLRCDGKVNVPVMEALKSIQQQHPHIVINIEFALNGGTHNLDENIEWPPSLYGFTPNSVALGTSDFNPYIFFDGSDYPSECINMFKDLQPQSLNLYTDGVTSKHIKYSNVFKHLTSIKHLNIGYDFVELSELKHLVDGKQYMHLESLKVDLITNIFDDNPDHPLDPNRLNAFQSAFESIWSGGGNSKIDYLALIYMPNVMSANLWNKLCHVNCRITKLLLNNGTVTNEMVPSLANLIATNTTITVLSIRGNKLRQLNNELAEAFKQNKTITVLDIGYNFCNDYQEASSFFNALLCSDTVQYFFLNINQNH